MLSRKGIYAVGTDSTDVTETILMQTSPFKIVSSDFLSDFVFLFLNGESWNVSFHQSSVGSV